MLLSIVNYETLLMLIDNLHVFLIRAGCDALNYVVVWPVCFLDYISCSLKSLPSLLYCNLGVRWERR